MFLNSKVSLTGKKKKKDQRFVRNVGLGFKTPREVCVCVCLAIVIAYNDYKNCEWSI